MYAYLVFGFRQPLTATASINGWRESFPLVLRTETTPDTLRTGRGDLLDELDLQRRDVAAAAFAA